MTFSLDRLLHLISTEIKILPHLVQEGQALLLLEGMALQYPIITDFSYFHKALLHCLFTEDEATRCVCLVCSVPGNLSKIPAWTKLSCPGSQHA